MRGYRADAPDRFNRKSVDKFECRIRVDYAKAVWLAPVTRDFCEKFIVRDTGRNNETGLSTNVSFDEFCDFHRITIVAPHISDV